MRERGLKYENDELPLTRVIVAPHAGAWIEISRRSENTQGSPVAPHAGAWIEIRRFSQPQAATRVAPMRGAWIEILPHR